MNHNLQSCARTRIQKPPQKRFPTLEGKLLFASGRGGQNKKAESIPEVTIFTGSEYKHNVAQV